MSDASMHPTDPDVLAIFRALTKRENAALRWMLGLGLMALAILIALLKLLD